MQISSEFVGIKTHDYETVITSRQTKNYAACINDHNLVYFEDSGKNKVIAPPMFSVAVTWQIIEKIWDFIERKDFPFHLLVTQVHYSEHLIFHKPIIPDLKVKIRGELVAILPHKSGTYIVLRLIAYDKDQNPVFTEYNGGLLRGVKCADEGKGRENLPNIAKFEKTDEILWKSQVFIDPNLPYIYDGCSNIHFPIHTSKKFALSVGLPDIILQGTATLAIAVKELINREASGNPAFVKEIFCNFRSMIIPGNNIVITLNGKSSINNEIYLFFEVYNANNELAISNGMIKISA